MSIAAQLAQGSKLFIAGTAGGAKNITAAAVGFPTILTSAAHGLANGDVVAIAAITGTIGTDATNGLNGKSFVIKNVTTNTFCIEANTTGLTYTSGGTATPNTWTQIKEVKGIKPGGAQSTKIDVTDLDSTAKEYRSGLMDNGTLGADIHILESDPGQAACLAAFTAATVNNYKVVTPAKTRTFAATCTKWPTIPDASVDGVQTGSAEWQISGAITVS
jgi:hypothetical protein